MGATFPSEAGSLMPKLPISNRTSLRYQTAILWNRTPSGISGSLESNYPNPFNPTTTIVFVIPKSERVALKIYDQLGREVAVLLESELAAGRHTVVFDAKNLASGVYIYRLQAGAYVLQKQMQLIK